MIMSKLFKKTLLIIIILFIVIAVTIAISSGWNLYKDLVQEYKSKGTAIAKSIAGSSVEILLNRDASTIQAMIDQFLEISGVYYVFVVDAQGEIVSHTFVPNVPDEILKIKNEKAKTISIQDLYTEGGGKFIDISAPILEGMAGYVHVGMDKGMIMSQMQAAMIRHSPLFPLFSYSALLWPIFLSIRSLSRSMNCRNMRENLHLMIFLPMSISNHMMR